MEAAKDKVTPLKDSSSSGGNVPEDFLTKSQKDGGKVALFVSVLAVILVAILYFALNQNIAGLGQQVDELSSLNQQIADMEQQLADVEAAGRSDAAMLGNRINTATQNLEGRTNEQFAAMDTRLGDVEERLSNLDELTAEARRMVMSAMLQELTQRVNYLSGQVESEGQAQNLSEAQRLLEQVQSELGQ